MDYQTEFKRLEEGGNFWKPKAGQYKVKALTEILDTDPYVRKGKEGQSDEFNPQAKIEIEVDGGDKKVWTFGKGLTLASTYGQLVQLATKHQNQLTGVEFNVVVKFDGSKNDYTIVE